VHGEVAWAVDRKTRAVVAHVRRQQPLLPPPPPHHVGVSLPPTPPAPLHARRGADGCTPALCWVATDSGGRGSGARLPGPTAGRRAAGGGDGCGRTATTAPFPRSPAPPARHRGIPPRSGLARGQQRHHQRHHHHRSCRKRPSAMTVRGRQRHHARCRRSRRCRFGVGHRSCRRAHGGCRDGGCLTRHGERWHFDGAARNSVTPHLRLAAGGGGVRGGTPLPRRFVMSPCHGGGGGGVGPHRTRRHPALPLPLPLLLPLPLPRQATWARQGRQIGHAWARKPTAANVRVRVHAPCVRADAVGSPALPSGGAGGVETCAGGAWSRHPAAAHAQTRQAGCGPGGVSFASGLAPCRDARVRIWTCLCDCGADFLFPRRWVPVRPGRYRRHERTLGAAGAVCGRRHAA